MSSLSTAYATYCHAFHEYELFQRKQMQMYSGIVPATEVVQGGTITDTLIRMLKALKVKVLNLVGTLLKWISKILDRDRYHAVMLKVRLKRIVTMYEKADAALQQRVDEHIQKIVMSVCWNKADFKKTIENFNNVCNFGHTTLVNALSQEIDSVISSHPDDTHLFIQKLNELSTLYHIEYNEQTGQFDINDPYIQSGGNTLKELSFTSLRDVEELANEYITALDNFDKLANMPNTLRTITYKLDIAIRDIQQDPTITNDTKTVVMMMQSYITKYIAITKNFVSVMRALSASIMSKVSAMMNKCRAILTTTSANESLSLQETSVTITNNPEVNRQIQSVDVALAALYEFCRSEVYKDIPVLYAKYNVKVTDDYRAFCRKETTALSTNVSIANDYISDPSNKETIESFMTDLNVCIKDTGLVATLSDDNHIVLLVDTHLPDMSFEDIMDRADYYIHAF